MIEYQDIVEELAEEIIETTEHKDDLDANITTFVSSLEQQIRTKVQELAAIRFCPECSALIKTVMDDSDGTNLEEITSCSNPDCPSHRTNRFDV